MSIFSDTKLLEEIGLTEEESQVYAALATNYFRTLDEVRAYSGQTVDKVASALESLENKKFIRKIQGKVDLYIGLNPHLVLTSETEKHLEENLNAVTSSVKEIWHGTSKELEGTVADYIRTVRDSTKNCKADLSSSTKKVLKDSKTATQSSEQDVHNLFADFMSKSEKKFTVRLEETSSQIEKQSETFLKLTEESTIEQKENSSELGSQIVQIASDVRNKPTEAIVQYRERVQENVISKIQETIDRISLLQDQLKEILIPIPDILDQARDGIETSIQNQGERSVEKFSANINELDRTLEEIESKTTVLASELVSDVQEAMKPLRESLRTIIADSSKSTSSVVSETSSSVQSALDEVKQKAEGAISTSKVSIVQTLANMETSVEKSTSELLNSLKTTFEGSKEQLSKVKEDGVTSLEARFIEVEEERTSQTKDTLANIKEVQEGLNRNLENLKKSIVETAENVGTSSAEGLDESISTISGNVNQFHTIIREQLESLDAAGQMVVGQMQGGLGEVLDSFSQQIVEKTQKSTETLASDRLPKEKETMKAKLEEALSSTKSIIDKANQLQKMFKEATENEIKLARSSVSKVLTSKITTTRDELTSALEKVNTNVLEEYSRMKETIPHEVELTVTDQRERVRHVHEVLRKALGDILSPLAEFVTDGVDEAKKRIKKKDKFEQFYSNLKECVDIGPRIESEIVTALNNNVDELSHAINDYLNFFSKTVEDSGQQIQEMIEDTNAKVKEDTQTLTATTISEIESFTSSTITKIDTNSSNMLEETESTVSNVVNSLSSVSESMVENYNSVASRLSNLSDFVNEVADQSRGSADTQLDKFAASMKGAIRTIIDQSVDQVGETFQDFLTKAKSSIRAQRKKVSERVTNAIGDVESAFQTATTSVNSTLEETIGLVTKLQEQTTVSLQATQSEISSALESLLVSQDNGDLESALKTLLKLHSEVESMVESLQTNFSKVFVEQQGQLVEVIDSVNNTVEDVFGQIKERISKTTLANASEIEDAQTAAMSEIDREFNRFEENLVDIASRQEQITAGFTSMKSFLSEQRETAVFSLEESIRSSQGSQKDEMSLLLNNLDKNLAETFEKAVDALSGETTTLANLRSNVHKDIEKITDSTRDELERLGEDLNTKGKQIDQSFTSKFDNTFLNLKGNIDSYISENKKIIHSEFTETISDLRKLIEKAEKDTLARVKATMDQLSELAKTGSEKVVVDLDALVTQLDTKSTATTKEISQQIGNQINNISGIIQDALEKTGSMMKFIRDVHDIAASAPPNPIEHTYYVTGKVGYQTAIAGAVERTKTSINIIVPAVSDLSLESLKKLPKTRRIQILADIDDESMVKELSELHNVQLRQLGDDPTIGFFRDGEEEGGIGAETAEGGQIVVTTDSGLVKTMNQLFADLWPRGKKL